MVPIGGSAAPPPGYWGNGGRGRVQATGSVVARPITEACAGVSFDLHQGPKNGRSDCCSWVDVSWTGVTTMKSIIVISLSLALITPALAKHHYTRPISYSAQPPSMGMMAPITSENYQRYLKNLQDAGYDPKNDYGSNGVIRDHLP